MKYCEKCHAAIEGDAKFCMTCGNPIPDDAISGGQVVKMRCANNHFYDGAKNTVCPFCHAMPVDTLQGNVIHQAPRNLDQKKPKKFFFGSLLKKKGVQEPYAAEAVSKKAAENQIDHTIAIVGFDSEAPQTQDKPIVENHPINEARKAIFHKEKIAAPVKVDTSPNVTEKNQDSERKEPAAVPEDAVTVSSIDMKTTASTMQKQTDKSMKTIVISLDDSFEIDPVVGWLVSLNGTHKGECFVIVSGKNRVGRLAGDIVISDEQSVSKQNHAVIIYDPKKRAFLLREGDGNGLTYKNDNLVLDHEPLLAYDKIQFGECIFSFVPFCNENFGWDDLEN